MGQRCFGRDGDNVRYDARAAFRIEQPKVCGGSGNSAKTAVFGLGGSRFGVCKKRRQGCCRQAHYAFYGILRAGGMPVYLRIFRRHSDSRRNCPTIGRLALGICPRERNIRSRLHQRLLLGGRLERTYGKSNFRLHRRGHNEKGVYTRKMNEVFEMEIEHIVKRLETLEHTVYGNGHKGLKAELIELKTEIETFKKNRRLANRHPPRHPLRRSEDFDLKIYTRLLRILSKTTTFQK